jgi:hypothetical protein
MWVNDAVFDSTRVGDILIVVNTPFNRGTPRLVSEVQTFDSRIFYPWMAGFLSLGIVLILIGCRINIDCLQLQKVEEAHDVDRR